MCTTFLTKLKLCLKGCTLLLALILYQLLCFLAFTSLSIGLSVLLTKTYEYFMSPGTLPSATESFICMYFISVFSEFHIFCQQECFGATIAAYDRKYRNLLTYGSYAIYTMVYFFAFAQIYVQFEAVHLSQRNETGHRFREIPVEKTGFSESDQLHTALFLLALSYLEYCTSKLVHIDSIENLKRITNPASCNHCVVTLAFFGLHFLINILYSIPLIIVGFSLRLYRYNGVLTFTHLVFVAFLSGVVFAVIETRRPWPTRKGQAPFFTYENNTRAKAILAQLQVYWVIYSFYSPNNDGKIRIRSFDAGNDAVLGFCAAVAYNVLHFVKVLTFIAVSNGIDPIQLPIANPRILDFGDDNDEDGDEGANDGLEVVIPPESFTSPDFTIADNSNNNESDNNTQGKKPEGDDENGIINGNNDSSEPKKSKTSPEIAELLAARAINEGPSRTKVEERSSILTKSEAEILCAVEKIEKAVNPRKPFPSRTNKKAVLVVDLNKSGQHESHEEIDKEEVVTTHLQLVQKNAPVLIETRPVAKSTDDNNATDGDGPNGTEIVVVEEDNEVWTMDPNDESDQVDSIQGNKEISEEDVILPITSFMKNDTLNIVVVDPEEIQNGLIQQQSDFNGDKDDDLAERHQLNNNN